jgi:hypothetical protein
MVALSPNVVILTQAITRDAFALNTSNPSLP